MIPQIAIRPSLRAFLRGAAAPTISFGCTAARRGRLSLHVGIMPGGVEAFDPPIPDDDELALWSYLDDRTPARDISVSPNLLVPAAPAFVDLKDVPASQLLPEREQPVVDDNWQEVMRRVLEVPLTNSGRAPARRQSVSCDASPWLGGPTCPTPQRLRRPSVAATTQACVAARDAESGETTSAPMMRSGQSPRQAAALTLTPASSQLPSQPTPAEASAPRLWRPPVRESPAATGKMTVGSSGFRRASNATSKTARLALLATCNSYSHPPLGGPTEKKEH